MSHLSPPRCTARRVQTPVPIVLGNVCWSALDPGECMSQPPLLCTWRTAPFPR